MQIPYLNTMRANMRTITKNAAILLFLGVTAILADYGINSLLTRQHVNDQKTVTTLTLSAIRAGLEGKINTDLGLLYGLAAHIAVQPRFDEGSFYALASQLLKERPTLKNIAAAPDFIIRHVYPLAGNEKAIGLDYRKVPGQWEAARMARDTGSMVIAGPVDLVQGGQGVIARIPVFHAATGQFWGLVSSVIDLDDLVRTMDMTVAARTTRIAIRGTDGKGERGATFWGDETLFHPEQQAVTMTVKLPFGSWQLAALPRQGWDARSPKTWFVHLLTALLAVSIALIYLQHKRSLQTLIENENRIRAMSQATHDALIMIDAQDTITFWNPAAEKMFGFTEQEMLGRKLHDNIVLPADRDLALQGMSHFAKTGAGPVMDATLEMVAVQKSGQIFPVERAVAAFKFRGAWYAVGSIRDISARKEYERRLELLATTDELTGLYNRRYLMEQAAIQLKQAVRYSKDLSFMIFDIDHFKNINDRFGHDVGDATLQALAKVLTASLRTVDIYGRIGGEEFAVVLPETDIEAARLAGERLREALASTTIRVQDTEITFTVSIGISHLQDSATTLSELFKTADTMLYTAKNSGRNRVVTDQNPAGPNGAS